MKKLLVSCLVAALCGLAVLTTPASAQVPQLINYQGRVAVGTTNFSGSGQFKFALVNSNGSTTYWSNDGTSTAGSQPTNAVFLAVTKGLYSVMLGDIGQSNMTVVPASVFNNSDVRLRVWFDDGSNGSQLLTPDQRIVSVGYAMIAGNVPDGAITGAKIAAGTITSAHIATGAVSSTQLGPGLTLNGTTNGTFSGNVTGNITGNAANFTGSLGGDVTGPQSATVVSTVGGSTAANVHLAELAANAATNANTANMIVKRDESGNVDAGTVTANINLPHTSSASVGVIKQNGSSLLHSYGDTNFFAGLGAGNFSMTGSFNTASGASALSYNTNGGGNTASGAEALTHNTTGNFNTASGTFALGLNTTGDYNTASGYNALGYNTSGDNNTALGDSALAANSTGKNNLALGANAGNALTTGSNNIDLGNVGVAGESNVIRIGTSQTATYLTGDVHLTNNLFVDGYILNKWTGVYLSLNNGAPGNNVVWQSSDARLKKNITTIQDALGTLGRLRGVQFHWNETGQDHLTRDIEKLWRSASGTEEDNRKLWAEKRQEAMEKLSAAQTGFIAQELEKVFPSWVRMDEKGYRQINVEQLAGVIVQGVNELNTRTEAQAATIATLKEEDAALRMQVADREAADQKLEARLAQLEQFMLSTQRGGTAATVSLKAN